MCMVQCGVPLICVLPCYYCLLSVPSCNDDDKGVEEKAMKRRQATMSSIQTSVFMLCSLRCKIFIKRGDLQPEGSYE